jgi:hypothetical protein
MVSRRESGESMNVLHKQGSLISRTESAESLLVDTHRGNARSPGLDMSSLNLNFYSPSRDRRPMNERNIICLGGPSPVSRKDAGGNTLRKLKSRKLTSLFIQEKNLLIRISMSKD